MKVWVWAIAFTCASTSLAADDARSMWLRGDWKAAEARLDRDAAAARRSGDRRLELSAARERVGFLLDRHSYAKHDPATLREAVESFHEAASRSGDSALEADAIHAMGRYRYGQMFSGEGEWAAVADFFQRARTLREASSDRAGLAESYFYIGLVHQMQGEAALARTAFERGFTYADADLLMQSFLQRHLGALDEDGGDPQEARRRYVASLDLRRRAGATLLVPFALNLLASHEETVQKNPARAAELYRESAALAKRTRSNRALTYAEGELARLARARGELRAARKHAARSLEAARAHGDPELVKEALEREAELRR